MWILSQEVMRMLPSPTRMMPVTRFLLGQMRTSRKLGRLLLISISAVTNLLHTCSMLTPQISTVMM
ncbi:hypothetical protein DJ68_19125 [Halorubrum sp. C3]|nr:hypothetical protein DJ68_19125 [Halorubrum sp. C3]